MIYTKWAGKLIHSFLSEVSQLTSLTLVITSANEVDAVSSQTLQSPPPQLDQL